MQRQLEESAEWKASKADEKAKGNSGGMLLNQDGEVIGVTSSKSEKLGSEGMGYYVPIDTVTKTVAELLSQAGR